MNEIRLSSGLGIADPLSRLLNFCREEYAYYDALPGGHPNRIEPLDIVATVGLNSRIDTAVKVRTVHRGMAEACDPLLEAIPETAELQSFETIDPLHDLFAAAMTSKYVLLATATKVLHRKRRALIPVLDSVVMGHYLQAPDEKELLQRSWENRAAAAEAAASPWSACEPTLWMRWSLSRIFGRSSWPMATGSRPSGSWTSSCGPRASRRARTARELWPKCGHRVVPGRGWDTR